MDAGPSLLMSSSYELDIIFNIILFNQLEMINYSFNLIQFLTYFYRFCFGLFWSTLRYFWMDAGHSRQGWKCRLCKINVHGDCRSGVSRCLPKSRLLRRQKSNSELDSAAAGDALADDDALPSAAEEIDQTYVVLKQVNIDRIDRIPFRSTSFRFWDSFLRFLTLSYAFLRFLTLTFC